MTKTEAKHKAQNDLMQAMQAAFNHIPENYSEEDAEILKEEASKQMARIEKMFGYEEYSWTRGC
jgi:hypothetical protein